MKQTRFRKPIDFGYAPVCRWDEPHPITGKTWDDMPGTDADLRKLNFFLYRRGIETNPEGWGHKRHHHAVVHEREVQRPTR